MQKNIKKYVKKKKRIDADLQKKKKKKKAYSWLPHFGSRIAVAGLLGD
jgi:hypothetical protein